MLLSIRYPGPAPVLVRGRPGGAIGAIVLVDCRRLQDSFGGGRLSRTPQPAVLDAINEFRQRQGNWLSAVRDALTLPAHILVINVDARNVSATDALIAW